MDQSPTAMFDSYEQDFRHIMGNISEKLEGGAAKGQFGGRLSIPEAKWSGRVWNTVPLLTLLSISVF